MLNKFKDYAINSLGAVGYVIWFVISSILTYAPLIILHFNFLIDIVIIAIIMTVPFLGDIVYFIIWVWSFFKIIKQPFDWIDLLYYIALAIWLISDIIPRIQILFTCLLTNRDS